MSIERDHKRFEEIGEQRRQDLQDFITYGDLGRSREDNIKIPIKIIDLPEFVYDPRDKGGVGQGDAEPGDPVGQPQPADGDGDGDGDGDEEGEPGEGEGEHGYYEMDPEEFAQELDEELGLDLEPKGKEVIEEKEGRFTEMQNTGPRSLLDLEDMFKRGLKRRVSTLFDEDYIRELLKVDGVGPDKAYTHAREQNITVSRAWIEDAYANDVPDDERTKYANIEEFEAENERRTPAQLIREEGVENIEFRREDQRFRRAETIKERQKNVVVINIRDVSGSMREKKRELVERTFTPLDWYLTGKYDRAEFHYVAHDATAWEVDRVEFFGIRSGGGTTISEAYQLANEILDEYPWSEWNRYVFAAGDGENRRNDTTENVIPIMEEMKVNQHAYVETQPGGGGDLRHAQHADTVEEHFNQNPHPTGNVTVSRVNSEEDVLEAVKSILEDA